MTLTVKNWRAVRYGALELGCAALVWWVTGEGIAGSTNLDPGPLWAVRFIVCGAAVLAGLVILNDAFSWESKKNSLLDDTDVFED